MTTVSVSITSFRPGSFSTAMLEPPSGHKKKRMLQNAVSLVVHTGLLAGLLVLPLLVTDGLNLKQLDRTILLAPPPPAAPAPPRPMVVHPAASTPKFNTTAKLAVPTVIPKTISMTAPDLGVAPSIQAAGGVAGGFGDVLGGTGVGAPPPPPPAAVAGPKKPVMISGDMKQPVLVHAPQLLYPPVAMAAHISGLVVILAIIDEHGDVIEAHAVSGPAILYSSALKSVSQRKYQPTILDGQPTPIQLRVEVNFHLSS